MAELSTDAQNRIILSIAEKIAANTSQVKAAIALLNEGASVPFIARYRKEATGGLDDTQLRNLEAELIYGRALEERRATILASVEEQGKLTDELRTAIDEATTKQRLEDLYLPFKPKRRTKAQIAKEAGLEPLADLLFKDMYADPEKEAQHFINKEKGVETTEAALNGARDILAEKLSENADMLAALRDYLWKNAFLISVIDEEKKTSVDAAKFSDYFDFDELISKIPSHRALALFRGREEGFLKLRLGLTEEEEALPVHPCEKLMAEFLNLPTVKSATRDWLTSVIHWTWRVKCSWQIETELFGQLRENAGKTAIGVFGTNLRDLLLAAPAGHKGVIGLDPGIRTGVKVAVISDTGAVLDTTVIYPHEPKREWEKSIATLAALAQKHKPLLISIGNGTASRETDALAGDLIKAHPELNLTKVVVSEAGASVYSASETAAEELPTMDVSFRGAVSIARRLQDPLAELVKIEPKAIGVGQYQHDVNQIELAAKLDAVVEDCVNSVGVDVNTASAALLRRVAGLNSLQAKRIVSYREEKGAFKDRKTLLDVPRLGAKAFEQAAGFLRIPGGINPLDASAVHPESYPVVEKILAKVGLPLSELIGNHDVLSQLKATDFTDEKFGVPTILDIFKELEKPGRDPRPEFKMARFNDNVHELKDLVPGMQLEGTVTNVTAFGAFVDIGVHLDGLVHISEIANRFIKDPREVVRVGQIVSVKVIDVDTKRNRVSLSMKTDIKGQRKERAEQRKFTKTFAKKPQAMPSGAMANAFAKILKK